MRSLPPGVLSGRLLSATNRIVRRVAIPLVSLPILLGGCADSTHPLEPTEVPLAALSATPATFRNMKGDLITGDAETFAQVLKDIGEDGEIIVWLKETDTPRPTAEFLASLPGSGTETIALATEVPGAKHRAALGPASVRGASAEAVARVLSRAGGVEIQRMETLPALTLRLPEQGRAAALQLLLRHPNVDYVSAVRPISVKLEAGPVGANPIDTKHVVHHVPEAWDLTRGSGAKIGVLDSGFAREVYSGAFHEDGRNFGGYGIVPLGFVDDACNNGTPSTGGCTPFDDQWSSNGNFAHGTAVTGIVGENDNNIGYVGIAPMALTYSMKVAWNTNITGHCGDDIFGDDAYCIESDDVIRAVDYAAARRFQVLSMSFTGDLNSDAYRAMATARNTYGVFLVAATGNTPGAGPVEPASFDVVMGVAGVDAAGNNLYSTAARDVSGYAGGATLAATCYKQYYCDAGSPGRLGDVGGTSAATAIVAGIVGLVRSYHPNETPAQIWERLVNTAQGPNLVVNAYAAITYQRPLSVRISGPANVGEYDYATWTAARGGGVGPYTYTWFRDGSPVASGATYSDYANGSSFSLQVTVTDALGASASDWLYVTAGSTGAECPPRQLCPIIE